MFRILPICKFIILSVAVTVGLLLYLFTGRRGVLLLMAVTVFWLWLYLTGLKIEITERYIIRCTGNIFKRESIILLKNIFHIQIITLASWRPAVVRLYGQGFSIVLTGLDGRQAEFVKMAVKNRDKY